MPYCSRYGHSKERGAGQSTFRLDMSMTSDGKPVRIPGLASHYAIVDEVGYGATARVYLATDLRSGNKVAIKVLHPELTASVLAARFHREIEFLRGLSHPNILPVIDAAAGERLYFVMPYAEGRTLRVRLESGPQFSLGETVEIIGALADALDFAHANNVIHRDLKPENVLFADGRVLLGDFGIARAIIMSDNAGALTASGIAIGTPRYMSPEQTLHHGVLDVRSDVYSLGCVAYEMLAGDPPYTESTVVALASAQATRPPLPIRTLRPDVPSEVDTVISQALAWEPAARPSSAGDFHARLRDAAKTASGR